MPGRGHGEDALPVLASIVKMDLLGLHQLMVNNAIVFRDAIILTTPTDYETGTKLGTAVQVVGCIMEVRLAHQEYFSCTGSLGCINSRSCLCNQKARQLHSNNADDVSCLVVRNMFLLRKLFCY